MGISERLKILVSYTGKSTRAVAISCGLNQPTLDRQIKGINNVNLETLTAVLSNYPEISADWLILGVGNMLREDNRTDEEKETTKRLLKLVDTIATLQDTINVKNDTIAILTNRIKELEQLIQK